MNDLFIRRAVSVGTLGASLLLFGCGGGGGDSGAGSSAIKPAIVSGVVSKGPLNGSTVCAYAIVSGVKGSLLGTCAANIVNGIYNIDIGAYTGAVLFEATGGTYIDEATGSKVSLDSPLHSVLINTTGGDVSVAITALTELAYQDATSIAVGLTNDRIQAAISSVQNNFGINDIIHTQPVDAINSPVDATPEQKSYALALATISQYQKSQSVGTSLTSALQSIQVCLGSSSSCGAGASSVGSKLNGAMATFKASHPALAGLNLPVASLGVPPISNTITVAGLNRKNQNGVLMLGLSETKIDVPADGSYTYPTSTSATLLKIIQQPAGQACELTKKRQDHFDPYTKQYVTQHTSDVYCYEAPCGNSVSLGDAPSPKELTATWDADSSNNVTVKWKGDPWANHYNIYYGTEPNVVVNNGVGIATYQNKTLGILLSEHTQTGSLDPSLTYYFAIASEYSSPSNLQACQSSASTVFRLLPKAAAPTVTNINPTSGEVGAIVTIKGVNFSATSSSNIVMFNGVNAVVTTATNTSITVAVPSGATTGKVTVTIGGLTATSSDNFVISATTADGLTCVKEDFGTNVSSYLQGGYEKYCFDAKGKQGVDEIYTATSLYNSYSYIDGEKNGSYKEYATAGYLLKECAIKNGHDFGDCITYVANDKYPGNLAEKIHYNESGLLDGLQQGYRWDSKLNKSYLSGEAEYTNGKRNGVAKGYFEDGRLATMDTFVNDQKLGPFIVYNETSDGRYCVHMQGTYGANGAFTSTYGNCWSK